MKWLKIIPIGLLIIRWMRDSVQDGKITLDELIALGIALASALGFKIKTDWEVLPKQIATIQGAAEFIELAAGEEGSTDA